MTQVQSREMHTADSEPKATTASGIDICKWMVANKYATAYDGGTKSAPIV